MSRRAGSRPTIPPIGPDELFRRVVAALGPYRESVVLVGGYARDLYRLHPGWREPGLQAATTNDVDLAVADPLRVMGDGGLHAALLAQGLVPRFRLGLAHQPVASAYFAAENPAPRPTDPHVEFVTPLRGPDREEPVSHPQRDELIASPLRYIDLLLSDPVVVTSLVHGRVCIPHPLHYLVQKTLIRPKRIEHGKQVKDQVDAFVVLHGLQADMERLVSALGTVGEWRSADCRLDGHR